MRKHTSVAANMIKSPNVGVMVGQRHNEGLYQYLYNYNALDYTMYNKLYPQCFHQHNFYISWCIIATCGYLFGCNEIRYICGPAIRNNLNQIIIAIIASRNSKVKSE